MNKRSFLLVGACLVVAETSGSFLPRKMTFAPSTRAATATTTQNDVPVMMQDQSLTYAIVLRGGSDGSEYIGAAYDWATNLGAPAALVAGAVIATLYENMASGSLDAERTDTSWVKLAKKLTRLLLVTAFILQIVCIFCTTILGTHLLSLPSVDTKATSALQFLKENFEFEYLTSRIAFIQGLITWIAAVALEHAIPQGPMETEERRRMDILIASSLTTLIIAMLSFYNGHMNFYKNYFDMLCQYGKVIWFRYVYMWPPRVMTVVAFPSFAVSVIYFFKVFLDYKGEDKKTR